MSTDLAPKQNGSTKQLSIRDHLQSDRLKQEIARALPSHMTAERMMRVALTAVNRVPKLASCTQESFFRCLLDLSSWGLEPDGRRAHLIPYGKECTLVLDYKGIVELAYRSGIVRNIHCDVVHAGDDFAFNLGRIERHTPWQWRLDEDRPEQQGDIVGAYAVIELKDGASHHELMTRDQIDSIRKRSKAGSSGPWVTDYPEMAKKTVFRRASKWLPLSAEMHDAFSRDADRLPAIESPQRGAKAKAIGIEDLLDDGYELDNTEENS